MRTRAGRAHGRPLSTQSTMHLVLRSSCAQGHWSFRRPQNDRKIRTIVAKFSVRYGVRVVSMANVGNHLHFQIKLANRHTYKPFIRAITAAIAMAVTGVNRWQAARPETSGLPQTSGAKRLRFWDYRPFTRIVQSYRAFLNLRDYLKINQLEGFGYARAEARWMISREGARYLYGSEDRDTS